MVINISKVCHEIKHKTCTCPEALTIEGEGVKVITRSITPESLAAPRVGHKPATVGPSDTQQWWVVGAPLKLVNDDLEVPATIHGGSLTQPHVDVGLHAVNM